MTVFVLGYCTPLKKNKYAENGKKWKMEKKGRRERGKKNREMLKHGLLDPGACRVFNGDFMNTGFVHPLSPAPTGSMSKEKKKPLNIHCRCCETFPMLASTVFFFFFFKMWVLQSFFFFATPAMNF